MEFEKYMKSVLSSCPFITPSAMALRYYYIGGTGRFVELRSIAEQFKSIYLQTNQK